MLRNNPQKLLLIIQINEATIYGKIALNRSILK